MTHKWLDGGNYNITVQAKDKHNSSNSYSQWSQPLPVNIHGPNLEIIKIKGGVGVTVVVKNIGDDTAHNIPWSISVWSILQGLPWEEIKTMRGTIPSLNKGETKLLWSGFMWSFNPIRVYVTVGVEKKQIPGSLIGPFIILRKQ